MTLDEAIKNERISEDDFSIKCLNVPKMDYLWLKEHCYRTLKVPCSPNVRTEHLAILDLIREHEEQQRIADVLDKIKAEIDAARFIDKDTKHCRNANATGLEVAMDIIDKYMA